MSKGIRWSAYVPASSAGGRRVASPDEDAFTMIATALEIGLSGVALEPPLTRIDVVGDCPPVADWGLATLLGVPLEIVRHPPGAGSFRDALEATEKGTASGGGRAVVAAELPERFVPTASAPTHAPGAAAIAAWVDGVGGSDLPSLDGFEGRSSVLDPAFGRWSAQRSGSSEVWRGDWGAEPDRGCAVDLAKVVAASEPPLAAVSEGAYVPRPRYLENLPSRWRFVAEECDRCGTRTFPARGRCRHCGNREGLRSTRLPTDRATVVAATWIGPGGQPTEFDAQVAAAGGYGVVLAELAPGARVTLQVTDAGRSDMAIGSTIATRLRRLYPMEGEWRYGRKAVPGRPEPAAG